MEHGTVKGAHPSGRRPGQDSTRAAILEAARQAFAALGYDGSSVRAIAADAGVDASTAIHFFGTKEGLFRAVIQDVAPSMQTFIEALQRGASGKELVERYLAIWSDTRSGPAVRALIRSSIGSERAGQVLDEALLNDLRRAITARNKVGGALALMHLFGLGIGLHIAHVPELTEADPDDLATAVGQTLDAYLKNPPAEYQGLPKLGGRD